MVNNNLSVEVSNNYNPKVMRLYDTSYYFKDEVKLDNYLIEVLPVNQDKWLHFPVQKNFSLVLNSSNLHYKKVATHDDLMDLPDGIYEFRQSYAPNALTVKHFYHFRLTELLRKIEHQKQKLFDEKCTISRVQFFKDRDKLRDITEYAMAAKWAVEECTDKARGKELYQFALNKLESYTNECQC